MYVKAILFLGNSSPVCLKKKKKTVKKDSVGEFTGSQKTIKQTKKNNSAVDAQNDLFALESDWQLTSY